MTNDSLKENSEKIHGNILPKLDRFKQDLSPSVICAYVFSLGVKHYNYIFVHMSSSIEIGYMWDDIFWGIVSPRRNMVNV